MTVAEAPAPKTRSLTLLLPAGRLPLPLLKKVEKVAEEYGLSLYLSSMQNLRLLNVKEEDLEAVKAQLGPGVDFKGPGKFPLPKVCAGKPHCGTGLVDTEHLSRRIMDRFGGRTQVKPKLKIVIAGCPLSCPGALLADLGIVATSQGYEIYAGGKGGPRPKVGRRILRRADEEQVLQVIGELVDFHDAKTGKKQRLGKLLDDPEFPYQSEA